MKNKKIRVRNDLPTGRNCEYTIKVANTLFMAFRFS